MLKLLHRGDRNKHLENSIEAIKDAINNNNFDGLEIDIRLTKDNKWIIYHDDNLKRLTDIDQDLINVNYINLPEIKHNGNIYKITLLEELTKLDFKNKLLNLEIKSIYNISRRSKNELIKIISKINTDILVSSFYWDWYKWCKTKKIEFGFLIEDKKLPQVEDSEKNYFIIDYNLLNDPYFRYKINKTLNIRICCYTLNNKSIINYPYYIEIWDN